MKFPTIGREVDDDLFAHTRMSFGDHIEELRVRMIRGLLGFLAALVIGLVVGQWVLVKIQEPLKDQLVAFYNHRIETMRKNVNDDLLATDQSEAAYKKYMDEHAVEFIMEVKKPSEDGTWTWIKQEVRLLPRQVAAAIGPSSQELAPPASLTTLTITEAFMTYFMVSIYCGIVLSSPWLFWQAWQFIGAGLYPHEKKYVYMYLPLSLALFLGGCALAQFVVLPLGIRYLLSFNEWLGVEPELRLSEWLGFAVMVPLIFGAAFQTPLVMLFLERLGIVEITLYTKNRKMAYFALAIIGAFLAAAPDALNMMMLTIPLWALFEFGILLCRFSPKPTQDIEEPDPDEMVEV